MAEKGPRLGETTGDFQSSDGLKIFYRKHPAEPERARVLIAHGLGEHSGRYGNLAERLVPKGLTLWAPDLRGHGRSEGRRGHVGSFGEYLGDLHTALALCREGLPEGRKCFLLGHSMGGLIALRFALDSAGAIDGVVVSSPALGVRVKVGLVKSVLGKLMSRLRPGLALGNELDASRISHDAEVVRRYREDPLVHDRVSARWFTEFLGAIKRTHDQAPRMEVPILMQVAGDDHLVDAEASRRFFDKLTLSDRTFHFYEGLYHEIYNEPEQQRDEVLGDLEAWLETRL